MQKNSHFGCLSVNKHTFSWMDLQSVLESFVKFLIASGKLDQLHMWRPLACKQQIVSAKADGEITTVMSAVSCHPGSCWSYLLLQHSVAAETVPHWNASYSETYLLVHCMRTSVLLRRKHSRSDVDPHGVKDELQWCGWFFPRACWTVNGGHLWSSFRCKNRWGQLQRNSIQIKSGYQTVHA